MAGTAGATFRRPESRTTDSVIDQTNSLAAFLDATAAHRPTPGGGAVSAVAGALAAAIGEMVLNYSVGKKGLEAHQDELRLAVAELRRARSVMLELMIEDQAAYGALTAARKLPEGSPEREREFGLALQASIGAPRAMAATAVAILELCDRVVEKVNHYLLSDLAVAADLATATARCATYNVRANLPDVRDPAERRSIESTAEQVLRHAIDLVQRVSPRIWARQARGA
jgi:formiminotetrahydrofolate cyclodeaminase